MKSLFSIDNPVMQVLTKMADMMIVNFYFIICCIPIVTIGASYAAAHKAMQNMALGDETPVTRVFFRAFRENFKQATITGLFLVLSFVSLICALFMIAMNYVSGMAKVMYIAVAILCAIILGIVAYIYPLMVRYNNTLKQHLQNAFIIALWHLPRTILIVALDIFPVAFWFFAPVLFMQTLVIWVMIGLTFFIFLSELLVKPILMRLEKKQEQQLAEQEAKQKEACPETDDDGDGAGEEQENRLDDVSGSDPD